MVSEKKYRRQGRWEGWRVRGRKSLKCIRKVQNTLKKMIRNAFLSSLLCCSLLTLLGEGKAE